MASILGKAGDFVETRNLGRAVEASENLDKRLDCDGCGELLARVWR